MKKTIIILLLAVAGLSSCKKDAAQPTTLTPAADIVFDGNYSNTAGTYTTYALATPTTKGTGSVKIAMTYSGDVKTLKFTTLTGAVVNDLGTVTVSGGSYQFNKLVKDLRGAADAPLPTSGSTGSVVLTVTLTLGDGTTYKRYFTINVNTATPTV